MSDSIPAPTAAAEPRDQNAGKRRGLFAAGAAFVAAVVARVTEQRVEAASIAVQYSDVPTVAFTQNVVFNTLLVANSSGFNANLGNYVFNVSADAADMTAVRGISLTGPGLSGQSVTGDGVVGQSRTGFGVVGWIPSDGVPSASAPTIGVYAPNLSTDTGGAPGAGGFGV